MTTPSPIIDLDGVMLPEAQAGVPVFGPAIATGTAVFETLRLYRADDGRLLLFRLDDHLDRLERSMALLRYKVALDRADITARIHRTIAANRLDGDGHLRLYMVPRAFDGQLGPVIEAGSAISAAPRPARPLRGVHATVSRWQRAPDSAQPAKAKCVANYVGGRLALIDAREAGFDDAILLNQEGGIAEAPVANLALIKDGRLVTPDAESGILMGLTRDTLLARLAPGLGLSVEERRVEPAELASADEVMLVSTGYELCPVVRIDGEAIGNGKIGRHSTSLAAAYQDLVRGRCDDAGAWLTEVATGA